MTLLLLLLLQYRCHPATHPLVPEPSEHRFGVLFRLQSLARIRSPSTARWRRSTASPRACSSCRYRACFSSSAQTRCLPPLPPLTPHLLQQRIDQQLKSKSDSAGNAALHERLHQVAIQNVATCFRNVTLLQLQQRKGPKKEWSGNKREMKEKEELEKVASSPAVYVPHSSAALAPESGLIFER